MELRRLALVVVLDLVDAPVGGGKRALMGHGELYACLAMDRNLSTSAGSVSKAVTSRNARSPGRSDGQGWYCAPAGLQGVVHRRRQHDEDLVGVDRIEQRRALERRQAGDQPARHGVGVAGVVEPQAVGEVGVELRRQQPHLGEEMAAALAPELESLAAVESKKITTSAPIAPFLVAPRLSTSTPAFQDSSAGEQPTKDSALAKRAPSMCSLSPWRWVEVAMAAISSGAIGRAAFGRLRDADGGGLRSDGPRRRPARPAPRRASWDRSCRPGRRCGRAWRRRCRTAARWLRRPRCARRRCRRSRPRAASSGQRQHVGGGAGRHRIGAQVGLFEDLAQAMLDLPGPGIGAIGVDGTGAEGAAHGLDDRRMGSGLVVAAEVQRTAPGGKSTVPSRAPLRGSTI